jgi:hypothetical protein
MDIQTRAKLKKAIKDAVEETSYTILERAQAGCPVRTGELLRSGKVRDAGSGFEIVFTAPHARVVGEGIPKDVPIRGVQTVYVKPHMRKSRSGKPTMVTGHTARYVNKRVIPIDGSFRVIDKIKKRPAVPYLKDAVEVSIEDLIGNIEKNVKSAFKA